MTNIDGLLDKYQKNDELEIRVGYFEGRKFVSKSGGFINNFLISNLSRDLQMEIEYVNHKVKLYRYGYKIAGDVIMNKKSKEIINLWEQGLRIALSGEKILKSLPANVGEPTIVKTRKRVSFINRRNNYRLDLTEDNGFNYQFEAEFLVKPTKQQVEGMIKYFNDIMPDLYLKQSIMDQFHSLLKSRGTTVGKKPRDLTVYEIPYLTDYVIYPKIDGIAYSLFYTTQGAHLVNPSNMIYWQKSSVELDKTLIQGELLNKVFYAYDIYFYKGKNVQDLDYLDRRHILQTIVWDSQYPDGPGMLPSEIPYYENSQMGKSTVKDVYQIIDIYTFKDVSQIRNSLSKIKNDGLIFIPLYGSDEKTTYKWKPPSKLTIDFVARRTHEDVYNVYAAGDKENVLFGKAKISKELSQKLVYRDVVPKHVVLEYLYDKQSKIFVPIKWRIDKTTANYITVARDIWDVINSDLMTEDYLLNCLFRFVINPDDNNPISKICTLYKSTGEVKIFAKALPEIKQLFLEMLKEIGYKNNPLRTKLFDYLSLEK